MVFSNIVTQLSREYFVHFCFLKAKTAVIENLLSHQHTMTLYAMTKVASCSGSGAVLEPCTDFLVQAFTFVVNCGSLLAV